MFAAKRNTGENAGASRAGLAVADFPGVSLVFLWDRGISASLVADRDAGGRSDVEAFLILVWMLPQLVKMQRPGSMA